MVFETIFAEKYSNPIELFFLLWDYANGLSGYQRTTATRNSDLQAKFSSILTGASEQTSCDEILSELNDYRNATKQDKNGAVLALMRAIDECIALVHPRYNSLRVPLPSWLDEILDTYDSHGIFWTNGTESLTFRGPLVKGPRPLFSSSADDLVDYFAAITRVPCVLKNSTRNIRVTQKVVANGGLLGITRSSRSKETLAIVPLAKNADDLKISYSIEGGQGFVDFSISSKLKIVEVLDKVIRDLNELDFLVLPELLVSEADAKKLSQYLLSATCEKPNLIVAGSGNTEEVSEDGLPYNETQVFNAFGKPLWRQQKVWTSGFSSERAREYGLDPKGDGFLLERNAESDEILVVDTQSYGRCVVLICQDLETKPLAQELIHRFQPDWVFIPVMDCGVRPGNWAHSKVFELSAASNARYVVVSSLSLADLTKSNLSCGIAVGPKSASSDDWDEARRCVIANLKDLTSDVAVLQWHNGDWHKSLLGTD
ncbi:hypothetical protein ACL58G_29025 [Massilia sp. GER05]|uniref:hypothetical protein n=1 Tax=Massilia sp. GER05 TaxID=3394605 RepID=UPI003F82FC33